MLPCLHDAVRQGNPPERKARDREQILMKQKISIVFILTVLVGSTYSQVDTGTVYKHLKTRKFYAVGLSMQTNGDQSKYEVNGKEVNESTYRKYERTWKNMENCCPCILKYYDENDILLRKAVSCTDCGVGSFKEYYSNGQVKLSGRFKENPTGNWDDIEELGFCSVPDGEWIYYNEHGKELYSEYWEDGYFIKQIPEQGKTEIWKVDLTLNGESIEQKTLTPDQLKDLTITPRFKNSTSDSVELTIEFQASAKGRKYLEQTFTLDSFKLFDLNNWLLENGYKAEDNIIYGIMVFNNQARIAFFSLSILADLPKSNEIVIISVDSSKIVAKNTDFYLVNSTDSTKKVKLDPGINYTLNYTEAIMDSLEGQKTILLEGSIVDLNNAAIKYDIITETIYLKLNNGFESETYNDYLSYNYTGNNYLRSISLEKLNYIDYASPSRDILWSIGATTTFFSVLTTAIVAPLASINYKNGDFNKNRYYTIAGSGVIGLSIGVPLIVFGKPKTYKLTIKNISQGKDLWYIQSQIR